MAKTKPVIVKIIFFIDCLTSGGKERRLTQLMQALRKENDVEFELVLMSHDIHYKEVFDWNIKIHYLIRKTKKDLSVFKQLYDICKVYKPDILHCWDSMTAVYSVPTCKLLHIKMVNGMVVDTPTQTNFRNKVWLRGKLTFPFSTLIIGNSLAGLAAYNAPKAKSICIHNGFNFDRIKDIKDNILLRQEQEINTKYVIGMVASFSVYKDYKTYYAAAQLLLEKRNDITFLAIGGDTDSVASHAFIQEKNKKYFRLLGKRSDVESLINMMDICVLATFTEGISNSILEYMALGKPVIATAGGGTNEIVDEGKTGMLVSQSDVNDLYQKMEILISDPEMCKQMGKAGKDKIVNHFSIDKMVKDYIVNYRSLIKS